MPFVFLDYDFKRSEILRLVGLSFFSSAQNAVGFYLAPPHVRTNASEAENLYRLQHPQEYRTRFLVVFLFLLVLARGVNGYGPCDV